MSVQTRRAREKEDLREEILDAARSLFVKEGYENVSIRKIADKVDYSPGTIYLYFRDKAEILERICEETFAKLDRKLAAIKDDPSAPLDRLRRGLRTYIQFGIDNPNHYNLTFMQGPRHVGRPESVTAVYCTSGHRCFQNLRECVRECIEAGELNCDDVDEAAQAIWAGIHGVVSLLIAMDGFPFIEQNRLVERVVNTLVEGFRRR